MSKTHWKQLVNPNYIGVYALPDGKDLTVTITAVKREIIVGHEGRKEECTVVYLQGQKPLILNKTNARSIERLYGTPYTEDWIGKQITLFASTTKLRGETVECLRIRPKVTQPPKEPLSDARFKAALEKIRAGQYTAEQLLNNFELTEVQKSLLLQNG